MSYAQVADMQARYPNRDLVQLTNEDPTITTVNTIFVQTYLDSASVEIDAYLESRFALPLLQPPLILIRLCCEIAMYQLNTLRPIHDLIDAKNRYDAAIKFLTLVSQGKLTLGNATDGEEPADPSNPAVTTVGAGGGFEQRVFTRSSMRGF